MPAINRKATQMKKVGGKPVQGKGTVQEKYLAAKKAGRKTFTHNGKTYSATASGGPVLRTPGKSVRAGKKAHYKDAARRR